MPAKIISGKEMSEEIRSDLKAQAESFKRETGVVPGLAAVLVGEDPASQVYVRNKRRACERVGISSTLHTLARTTTQDELLDLVSQLNEDSRVHGILVQLPLPEQISEERITEAVRPLKDVDGFSPENLGLLAAGRPRYLPCTPHGVQQMLLRSDVDPAGKHVVIVGRSNIVGKPLALILMQKLDGGNATVTVCHSRTPNIKQLTLTADIVVVAIGKAGFLTGDMVRPGAVVIDVGINRVDGKLVGDVEFQSVAPVAAAISPVPGGVGPMTITMLLHNTLRAAKSAAND